MTKKHALLIGLVALVAAVSAASLAIASDAGLTPLSADGPTAWAKNALGVTYGSGMDAKSPEDEPDLIRVEATNGKVGYAYRTALEGPEPSSPSAAIAQQKAKGGKPDVIPVYEVDGVTQIGVFLSDNPAPK
jgi:hypothetical protein